MLVAQWSLAALSALSPVDLGSIGHLRLSYPVLAFTAAVSLATAVICDLAPAYESARTETQEALKDGARGAGAGLHHRRMRHAFVVAEIALAVVLLVGAGLLLRSFAALSGVDPGLDTHNVLTARMTVPPARYPTEANRLEFFREAVARVSALLLRGRLFSEREMREKLDVSSSTTRWRVSTSRPRIQSAGA
ncbi:MAG: hypothetical protein LAO77_24060 [Acidobacteriia bacterium]|nr:hypothetical protein [Terriglobia bacterium]